ncbi:C-3',4' desaturase CrtD [Cyanobacterium stanieri PCC 7202]|uniref:C-3',4' desaturase CrtD n=1 Tax=Cyanobacterium stanieri (strain ATCC 29140 / PCC 7202) TaxID=292563 RepID=K9YL37_CYASC|nr:C-3',4' desaturase CrtD [Cyanobacterium stanieri PCC 7202]
MKKVVVIGAGIGGLTAGALLAKKGYDVTVYEQAMVPGGCASTFKRRGFTFDVGATQVAGLEEGGIHERIFRELDMELPPATTCDPACAVFLPEEKEPIMVWRNPEKWQEERNKQFPDSEKFWSLFKTLFDASWRFQGRDPVLPPRNSWDFLQLIKALRLDTFVTVPFTFMTVANALNLLGLKGDRRLKTFLDLQLKLYSQVDSEETALLYAATALSVSQEPQGLYHLEGSMQVLCDRLVEALKNHGGTLKLGHFVEKIHTENDQVKGVTIKHRKKGEIFTENAEHVIGNLTVNNLVKMTENLPKGYGKRVEKLEPSSGAFVVYLGVDESAIPENCPPHLQFLYDYDKEIGEINSLFVSVSKPNDGRAPQGKRTIVASSFTDTALWWNKKKADYDQLKQEYSQRAIARLGEYFHLTPETIIHQEIATPLTFAKYTAREKGIVGGVGQRISTFGPFGFAPRTPIKNLWLVGDSVHPGEGTAGVSYSALTIVRQINHDERSASFSIR